MRWGRVRCSEGGVRASHRPQSTAQRPRRQDSTPRRIHMASEHGVCTTHETLPRPADRRDRTARLTRSTRWAPVVDARRPEQLQSCNAIVAPAHVGGWTEGIRRVFMWAEARAYDAMVTAERSAAASAVPLSSIHHLCARLGSDSRLSGTCRTCHGWAGSSRHALFCAFCSARQPLQNVRLIFHQSGRTRR